MRRHIGIMAAVTLAACSSAPPAKSPAEIEAWSKARDELFRVEQTAKAAAQEADLAEYRRTVVQPLSAAIATTTDPTEFADLRQKIFRETKINYDHATDTIYDGPCRVDTPCYDDMRQLLDQWRDRRGAVAKANRGCARRVDAIVARDLGALIGAPAECVWIAEGWPQRVNRSASAGRYSEQLVYGSRRYVYITNGVVTGAQF